MKTSLVLLICSVVLLASASYYPQCNAPVIQYCQRANCNVYYVDPVGGSANGDGSSANPWKDFSSVMPQIKSRQLTNPKADQNTYPPTDFTVKNPNGKIVGGDVIALRSGMHSTISLLSFYNEIPVTITADLGHAPIVNGLSVSSSANWIIKCLNFTSTNPNPNMNIVTMDSQFMGVTYNVVFEMNTVYSYPDIEYYRNLDPWALYNVSASAVETNNAFNITIRDNYMYHNKRGVVSASQNVVIQRNVIDYIVGDGMRITNNNTLAEFNLIMNSMNTDNNADHRDGIQLFTWGDLYPLHNVTIRNNKLLADYDKNRPFADGYQGISAFDVPLYNIVVENNLVSTINFFNGISMYYANNVRIVGNTVVDASGNSSIQLWITTRHGTGDTLIQNNIAHGFSYTDGAVLVSNAVKRWTVDELNSYFIDPYNSDFRLRANASSPFIGKGNATDAPVTDVNGDYRSGPYDMGCYAFTPVANPGNPPTIEATPDSNPNTGSPQSSANPSGPSIPNTSPSSPHLSGSVSIAASSAFILMTVLALIL